MKTQAFGWLAAAVLAAGLNASYHDGGLEWAHRAASRVEHNSAAVLALASGHVGQFLAEARLASDQMLASDQVMVARSETASCPWSAAVARAQARMARGQARMASAQTKFARLEEMSSHQQARWQEMEAHQAEIQARIAAQTDHLRARFVDFDPVALRSVEMPTRCQRIRVNVPQMPTLHIQAPQIDLNLSAGPI